MESNLKLKGGSRLQLNFLRTS
ncbi:hypothetical protein M8C21_001756 [Ambrosia artemisiifolia]|uniref:Uncharacterized protein n=1 Tax=Ambrosia artemisiifolia TaxID=4212 RepID=A0AAD5CNU3_AMBAR|nr:hypothetical protein M8C21_001756 [Ambrosia artemisiifolia]